MRVVAGSVPRRTEISANVLPASAGSGSKTGISTPSGEVISSTTKVASARSSKSRFGNMTVRVECQ